MSPISAAQTAGVRVVAVADSDSYLKWGAGLLNGLPAAWSSDVRLVRSVVAPDNRQVADAVSARQRGGLAAPVTRHSVRSLIGALRADPPDVLVLACTGPAVALLLTSAVLTEGPRPVLVTGLPGLAVPASDRAWQLRRGVDVFVVHSRRERAESPVVNVGSGGRPPARVALTRLPFLEPATVRGGGTTRRDRVVFAPQAKVPVEAADRTSILLALADLAARRPELDVTVKLRAESGQAQTHRERVPYQDLWRQLARRRLVAGDELRFATGPMREHLDHAVGLVTVSSTSALEALAAGVPVRVLGDFGVGVEMINEVFRGSGLIGSCNDVRIGSFACADTDWSRSNYLHDRDEDDLVDTLDDLVARRRRRGLPALASGSPGWRARARSVPPVGAVRVLNRARARGRILVPHA